MIPDRRRRCSVLPYCGACRAVWSERRRRGCICSPPPIGGNHDRLNLLRLRGSRHHHRSRGGRRCREHRRGKSGRRRTRLARNQWDRRSLARLRGSRYRRRSQGRRRDRCCCKHRRGKSGHRRSRRDRPSLARLRGSRYRRRSRGGRWDRCCCKHRRSKSGHRRSRRDRGSLARLRGSRYRRRSRGGRRDRWCNVLVKSRRHGRIKSGRSSSRREGYWPSARSGRNRDIGNDARLRFRRLPNVDRLQFFAPAGAPYGRLELLRRVSLLFWTMSLGPAPAMTIGGSAGNTYPPKKAR